MSTIACFNTQCPRLHVLACPRHRRIHSFHVKSPRCQYNLDSRVRVSKIRRYSTLHVEFHDFSRSCCFALLHPKIAIRRISVNFLLCFFTPFVVAVSLSRKSIGPRTCPWLHVLVRFGENEQARRRHMLHRTNLQAKGDLVRNFQGNRRETRDDFPSSRSPGRPRTLE